VVSVNGKPVNGDLRIVAEEVRASAGEPVEFELLRDKKPVTVSVTPTMIDGTPRVGVRTGPSFVFPFDVGINIDPRIGGPSAGLMFSLAIYDTLTQGSLTGGKNIAGTGTIDPEGNVGPIGGIQQKIPGARDAGAELFLVPEENCAEALTAANGDMRLARVKTLDQALEAVRTWVADPKAELPSCKDVT
jgi:PDZ domain-containing protein